MSHATKARIAREIMVMMLAGAVPVLFAASPERKEARAQILEQTSIPCANCFFGAAHYFFCFQAGDRILLAEDKVLTVNYSDSRKNFLGKLRSSWKSPVPSSESITIQYDGRHVWMPRADGKLVRMNRENSQDVFSKPQCRAAVRTAAGG